MAPVVRVFPFGFISFCFFFRVFEKFRFDPPFKLGPTTENPVKLGTTDIDGLKLVKLNEKFPVKLGTTQ